jgi:hypothetical protein
MATHHGVLYLNESDHAQAVGGFGTRIAEHQQVQNQYFHDTHLKAVIGTDIPCNVPLDTQYRGKDIATEYGITVSKPKYQQYAIKDIRLQTFKNWPSGMKQRPGDLAEAGFFYSGGYLQ